MRSSSGRGLALALLVLLAGAAPAHGAVGFDAFSSNNVDTSSATYTQAHTMGASATYLVVGVIHRKTAGNTVSGITWNGAAMASLVTPVDTPGGALVELSVFGLATTDTGTHNVVVTLTGAQRAIVLIASFTSVSSASATSATGVTTTATITVVSSATGMVVDMVALQPATTATVGADQTSRFNADYANVGQANMHAMSSTEPGAASVTMSWALGALDNWATVGVALAEAPPPPPKGTLLLLGVGQ